MKVLFVSGMFSTKYGGFEKFTVELLEQGVDLSIIYNSIPDSLEYLNDLEKYHVGVNTVVGNIFQRAWQTYKIIRREKPDIVHFHFGFIVYFLFLIIKLFHQKAKQILTLHCEYNYKSIFWNTLTQLCYRSLDCVTCVSNGVRQGLIKKIGDSKHYIVHYLGVSKRGIKNYQLRNELQIGLDELVITSIGFDIEVKGFDLLAKSVSELRTMHGIPKFKVIIIGLSKQENCKYQEILHKYGVEDCILSVGIRNDIDDFLFFTDIYTQPSRTEAISLSIMEALLYGIPIIGANVGGISEVCISDFNGMLFEKGNSQELTMALRKLLLDEKLRIRYGKQSLELAKKYDKKSNVMTLIKIYEQLLSKK
jgi:glycosyltransferase involved in cell wall biosynthesis